MPDIIELIKKQGEKRVADIQELAGKLSGQLRHLISLIPEDTRNKSLETFLNDIRQAVLGEGATRQGAKRGRKPSPKRGKKAEPAAPAAKAATARKAAKAPRKSGRKKKESGMEKKPSQAARNGQETA